MALEIIILAAGKGKRMNSALPKVLNTIAGVPLLKRVIDTSRAIGGAEIHIIYGHNGEQVRQGIPENHLHWVKQQQQLGTGHAVLQAMPNITDDARVIVLYGDVPLLTAATLERLIAATPLNGLGILTAVFDDPKGYGRIIRNAQGDIIQIVEERDANATQRAIQEINTGIYCAPAKSLKRWLAKLTPNNAQGEYLITDIIGFAVAEGTPVISATVTNREEVLGINDRMQQATLERCYQRQQAERLLQAGVTLMDPARIDIRGELIAAQDVVLDINVIIEGRVELGAGTVVGPNCVLRDVVVGSGVKIKANSVIEEAKIGDGCIIGPFARIRPGTELAEQVHIGNFVELKKTQVAYGSKINHLSYIGDAVVGKAVNIGAGTITCNYDGVNKYKTTIADGVFIGSGTELVAPINVGTGAYIGAGSTLTQDAPAETLTLARARQVTIEGWKPKREK